jgi:hypothetical protein
MERDTQDTAGQSAERPTCPDCGHVNIPGAAFCARCGRSLDDEPPTGDVIDVTSDSQATSTFEPVTSTVTAPPASPWARPGSIDSDPGLTTALPTPEYLPVSDYRSGSDPGRPRGARGFWLGLIALLLMLAVLAVYLYAAWLSDSARSTIDGWLPWM